MVVIIKIFECFNKLIRFDVIFFKNLGDICYLYFSKKNLGEKVKVCNLIYKKLNFFYKGKIVRKLRIRMLIFSLKLLRFGKIEVYDRNIFRFLIIVVVVDVIKIKLFYVLIRFGLRILIRIF